MVLQPVRFVDAHYNFTPTQRDFIMMVQYMTQKQPVIKSDFKIDLKSYFKEKGASLSNVRSSHYKELCDDLLSAKVGFQYFKGNTLYSYYNLFSHCSLSSDLILTVSIIDDVLPLFYINKLKEGHFKENKLVKKLFEQSFPEYDTYVAYLPKTYVDFGESSTKKLFEKLLQYRKLKSYSYEFSKDEIYFLLGYGEFVEKKFLGGQQKMFDFSELDFKQTKYIGKNGWKNFSKQLNIWLKEISEHKDSTITIKQTNKRFFQTVGRPIRSIKIDVTYDGENENLSEEQIKSVEYLEQYKLSEKQKYVIVKKHSFKQIKTIINENVVKLQGGTFGEFKRADYRKIDNISGFVYSIFFKKT